MDSAAALRRYPLLAALGPAAVDAWVAAGTARELSLGETLFRAGTPGTHAYLVLSGRVRVARPAPDGREVVLGAFGPGELFGEYALLPPGLNTATCRAADPGEVLRLPLGPLRDAVAAASAVGRHLKRWLRLHAVLGHLRDRSFLGFMSAGSLLPLLDRCETVRLPAGRTIQADGLAADRWFAVLKGRVAVESRAGPADTLGAGDSFGERGLLDGAGLPAAEAVTDVTCVSLRRDAFHGVLAPAGGDSLQTVGPHPGPGPASYPWVGQRGAADCGAAALEMVVRFHGLDVSPAAVRRGIGVGGRGTSLLELQRAGAALGFRSRAVRVGPEQLARVGLPAIAHLAGDHYVVLYAAGADGVVVGDPAVGVRTLTAGTFQAAWTQHLLLLVR